MTTTMKREAVETTVVKCVEDMWEGSREIAAHGLLLTTEGEVIVVPAGDMGSEEAKDEFVSLLHFTASVIPDVAVVAIVAEAWMRKLVCATCTDLSRCPHLDELVKHRENYKRTEVVTIHIEYRDGLSVFYSSEILRPKGAPAVLSPGWERTDTSGQNVVIVGRFASPLSVSREPPVDPLEVN